MSTLAQIGAQITQKFVKKFTLEDVIKYKNFGYKTMVEICQTYPNQGIGFKFWRKTWPKDSYWIVKEVKFKSLRHGKIIGIQYRNGTKQQQIPLVINNTLKRGVWKYSINGASCTTENGLHFTTEELEMASNKSLKNREANSEEQQTIIEDQK